MQIHAGAALQASDVRISGICYPPCIREVPSGLLTGPCWDCRAVSLLVSNALRVAVVSVVGDFLIWMGKLCIACAAGLLAFAISDTKYYTDPVKYPSMYLTSPILPIALSILIAYIVASLFSMVSALTL